MQLCGRWTFESSEPRKPRIPGAIAFAVHRTKGLSDSLPSCVESYPNTCDRAGIFSPLRAAGRPAYVETSAFNKSSVINYAASNRAAMRYQY